jgi:PUA domain protein
MAPGLTSKGGRLPIPVDRDAAAAAAAGGEAKPEEKKEEAGEGDEGEETVKVPNEGPDEDGHWSRELEKGEPVVIRAEGKEEAAAVGILTMGTKEIKEKGKGPVLEASHYLGDGLWRLNVKD